MKIIVRILFQLVLVYSVYCRDDCYVHKNGPFKICRTNPTTLSSVRQLQWRFSDPIPTELEITHHEVTNVSLLLFVKKTEITVLKLNLANAVLNFNPLSFLNLTHLKRLEINNGTVLLKEGIFQHLHQLESLTLAVDESIWNLNDILQRDLGNLTSLEILNAERVNICPKLFNHAKNIYTINRLTFRGGPFNTLEELAFTCLRNLEFLKITGSNLQVIRPRAFGRLGKIRLLELSGNPNLTHIPSSTFDNFEALDTLLLMNNRIQTIDDSAFQTQFHPLETLNISGNAMKRIEAKSFNGLNCTKLDLSSNPTWNEKSLARNSFKNSQIKQLYVSSAVYSKRNFYRWGLQREKTSIHYRLLVGSNYIVEGINGRIHTSTGFSSDNMECDDCWTNKKYMCCIKNDDELGYVAAKPGVNDTDVTLTLDLPRIGSNAFLDPAVEKLTISLVDSQELTLEPQALGLKHLQELQIFNGPVIVRPGAFLKLESLKILAIQVQEGTTRVCQVLSELPNLEYLEIHNHQGSHDICHQMCQGHKSSIKRLMYLNGMINVVNEGSLDCLKNLEHLHYYSTNISSIEESAFRGLANLKSLSFFHTSLHKVPAKVFSPLVSLEYLQINEIGIRSFDSQQFKQMVDNTSNYADYSDQLFFGLSHPQLLKFSPLNIYRDDLVEIRFAGDEIKWISQDKSREYSSKSVSKMSFLPPSVFPVLQAWDAPSRVVDQDFGDFCRNSSLETPFRICVHARDTLVSVTNCSRSNVSLAINEDGISSIKMGAFSNINIKQLLLNFFNAPRLRVTPKSFEGLSGLEILILNTGPLDLGPNLFQELHSLVELRFSYRTAGGTRLCQVLTDLPKLQNLVIYDQDHVDICHVFCWNSPKSRISQLQYIGGGITVLESGSFRCLGELEHLTITETNLMIIEPDAFEGLDRINTIKLTHNILFKYILPSSFDNLPTLKSLRLEMNSIESIGVQAFKFSRDASLEVLDLRYNNISVIEPWTFANLSCRKVDLSFNPLSEIRFNSFHGSNIAELFLLNDRPAGDYVGWGLQDSTTVFYN